MNGIDLSALTEEQVSALVRDLTRELKQRHRAREANALGRAQQPLRAKVEGSAVGGIETSTSNAKSDTDPDYAAPTEERSAESTSSPGNVSERYAFSNDSSPQTSEDLDGALTEDEGEDEAGSLEPPQSGYDEELLTPIQKGVLTSHLASNVTYHSRQQSFGSLLNKQIFELSRCIESPGSWIVSSKEQSGKTVLMAAMALVSMQLGKPCVIVVNDKKANVGKVSNDLKGLLGGFGMDVHWMGQKSSWDALRQSQLLRQGFVDGAMVPVLQCYFTELTRLNHYLQEQGIFGLTVIMDECDSIWSTKVEDDQAASGDFIKRELEMYQLLKGSPLSPQPLSQGSAVRSFIQVSATHLATMHWHSMWKIPVRHIIVSEQVLRDRGYILETHLRLVNTIQAPCKANEYAMRLPEVAQELQTFANDARSGRLMFFCTCPYVHAANMVTTFDIAKEIVNDHVPSAVCIVVHGGGVHAIYQAQQSEGVDYLTGMGRTMYEPADAGAQIFGKKRSTACLENQEPTIVKQANTAISIIDSEMGLQRPIIVLGYNCVGRCVSIRSEKRVINYMIAAYSSRKTSADLKQMMMRGAGFTRQVREEQGFDYIRLTSTAADWEVLQKLYDLQLEALTLSATGNVEDLDNWYHGDYNLDEYRALFEVKRPHIRRRLGQLDFIQHGRSRSHVQSSAKRHKQSKTINLQSSRTRFMQAVYAAHAANGDRPVHEQTLMRFLADHPEYLPHSEYSMHHNAERSVCSRHCHWIRTDEHGYIHLTPLGIDYRARLQAAVEADNADMAGPSIAP